MRHPGSSGLPAEGPCLLAFDTSTEQVLLAVVTPDGVWSAVAPGGSQASATLIPQALALLARAGRPLAGLDAIGFGAGPGAFTGLRTACAVAQGLAFGIDRPVLALDSLALLAEAAEAAEAAGGDPAASAAETLWVAQDARMDEVYAAAYRRPPVPSEPAGAGGSTAPAAPGLGDRSIAWEPLVAPALYTPAALAARWAAGADAGAGPVAIVGSALEVFGARLDAGRARRLPLPGPEARAAALARLAVAAWQAGRAQDAAQALPVYLRDKVALTTVEREAAARAKAAGSRP